MKAVRITLWPTWMVDKVDNQIVFDAIVDQDGQITGPDAIFGIWGKVLAPDRWPFVLLKDGKIDWGDGDVSTCSIRKEVMKIGTGVTVALNLREDEDLIMRTAETGFTVREVMPLF